MATEMQLFTVASLLRRGRALDGLSCGLSATALLLGLAPLLGATTRPSTAILCVLLILLGLVQKYWALRVALDAELFQRLADNIEQLPMHTAALDEALINLKLQPANPVSRSWDERSHAALRLLRRQALWLLAQLLLAVLTIVSLPWLSITG